MSSFARLTGDGSNLAVCLRRLTGDGETCLRRSNVSASAAFLRLDGDAPLEGEALFEGERGNVSGLVNT